MHDLLTTLRQALGDRFRLDRELTGGGMSRVFVAEELALGRQVVLKVLPPDAAATVNADRFRREVLFAAKLQHPHIVPVLAAGEDAGTLWYSMPFVEGDTLRGRLTRQGLPVREALTYWQHMLDALSHAHRAGLVHRDIKPENVLVSGRHALVTDFGIAKAVASAAASPAASGLTGIGFVVGTPAYMAPEQAVGGDSVDARTDLYAAALVAYEMLTGKAAFGGLTPPQTLAAQVQTMPAAPRTLNAAIPAAIDALLMQCLAKDPQHRPASADAVLQALDAIAREPGALAGPATPSRPAGPRVAGALMAATLVLGAGLVWRTRASSPATPIERDLVLLASLAHEPKDSSTASALAEALRIDLQQSPRLKVADPQVVRAALVAMRQDPSVAVTDSIARVLGVRLGAKAYVTGALSSVGTAYVLTARLVSVADGSEVAALRETAGAADDLLTAADRLSKGLRERAGESVASLRASPALPAATTASLEALERYASGSALLRTGKSDLAIAEFERAIALDSSFATAWSGLGTALYNLRIRPGDQLRAVSQAYALRRQLPEIERLRIESRYFASRGERDLELGVLRRILSLEPTTFAALNNLAYRVYNKGELREAESLMTVASRLQPQALGPIDLLTNIATERGDRRLLDSLERTFPTGADGARLRWTRVESERMSRADYAGYLGQLDSAIARTTEPSLLAEHHAMRAYVGVVLGRLRTVESDLEQTLKPQLLRNDPESVPGWQRLLAAARARFLDDNAGALRLIARSDAFYTSDREPVDRTTLERAMARLSAGDIAGARRLLQQVTAPLPRDTAFVSLVRGELALAEGKPADAVRILRGTAGAEYLCPTCNLGALARAYDALGQRDSALAVYTRLLDSRFARSGRLVEDILERPQALRRAGELLEDRRDLKGALARYRAFVELWQDADPELQPIVQEVRERIARLERARG
jgi:serine/threonine protein kinase/tetratricopeptide (TPR) repeat protein